MSFIKFPDRGITIRRKDIAAVELQGFKGVEPKLILYVRGIAEPFVIAKGNQQYMKNKYDELIKQLEEEDH
jgi:hypothetical protein